MEYPTILRECAVRRVLEVLMAYASPANAAEAIANEFEIHSAETLLIWVRRDEMNTQRRGGADEWSRNIGASLHGAVAANGDRLVLRVKPTSFASRLAATLSAPDHRSS